MQGRILGGFGGPGSPPVTKGAPKIGKGKRGEKKKGKKGKGMGRRGQKGNNR